MAEDQAEVLALDETREVPARHLRRAAPDRGHHPLEPGLVEWKFYARGLGVVLEETVSGGGERVELLGVREP